MSCGNLIEPGHGFHVFRHRSNSIQGATTCYAVVTTGEEWQFGMFDREEAVFIKQIHKLSVFDEYDEPGHLQKLFDSLNWLFERASRVEIVKDEV